MSTPLDLSNIQGDILDGLPKKGETFFFFRIVEGKVEDFCTQLMNLVPLIATAAQVQDDRARIAAEKKRAKDSHTHPKILDMSGINIAFSQKGLKALSINDDIGDKVYQSGMLADATLTSGGLGDLDSKGHLLWQRGFKQDIHGVILVTGSSHPMIDGALKKVKKIFHVGHGDASIVEVIEVEGHTRPGDISGHEHFGFNDGISQPFIEGFGDTVLPGQEEIRPGIVLTGHDGDTVTRPTWAVDGSFMVFRKLTQLVPEFDAFLTANALAPGGPAGAELLGARLVGRWKSGAPIDLTPTADDKAMAADKLQNNNFTYDPKSQDRCPFAAHTRKTNPRADLNTIPLPGLGPKATETRRIMRRGIQFGPEVSDDERSSGVSSPELERGLLFVCYQSNIANGFQFIQKSWANNPNFPPFKNKGGLSESLPPIESTTSIPPGTGSGFDPIIGVDTDGQDPVARSLVGTIPVTAEATTKLDLTNVWVVPKGGEYFFSPSISALQDVFAQAA